MTRADSGVLCINLEAIADNWTRLRDLSRPARCAAVVKADAYGLGLEPVGRALHARGCRHFFVARLAEGVGLRQALGSRARVYVLDGPGDASSLPVFEEAALIPVLNSPRDISLWQEHAARTGRRGTAVLHLDTGMARLGLSRAETQDLASATGRLDGLGIELVMTHLACADEVDHPLNALQRKRFDSRRAVVPDCAASMANSAGIFLGDGYHYDLTRPGAALYGISRSTAAPAPMKPVVSLKARILQVQTVEEPGTVGYGATRNTPVGLRLATAAAGYADGYLRALSNRGHGCLAGVKVPVAGRVSMDLVTFDVSAVPEDAAVPGGYIDLINAHHTVDDLADEAGTIGYEILTSLGRRYTRVYRSPNGDDPS